VTSCGPGGQFLCRSLENHRSVRVHLNSLCVVIDGLLLNFVLEALIPMNSHRIVYKLAVGSFVFLSSVLPFGSAVAAEKAIFSARAEASDAVSFDLYLPLQHRDELESLLGQLHDPSSPIYQKWLTPQQFHQRFELGENQTARIKQQLSQLGIKVTQVSPRHFHLTGNAAAVERSFATTLMRGKLQSGQSIVAATNSMLLPSSAAEVHAVVVGLSSLAQLRTQSHTLGALKPENRTSGVGPYWFTDLKQAYSFPSVQALSGKGVTLAILLAGEFVPADMDTYFGHEKLPTPSITEIKVDGGSGISLNSFESNLDLEQSGGMAPGANILFYNAAALTDESILSALDQIVTDNRADVVSMSFGSPEITYTAPYNDGIDRTNIPQEYDDLFAQGNAQGITFIAASGDQGAVPALPVACLDPTTPAPCGSYLPSTLIPASSPHVTAVGGTNLTTTFSGDGTNLNSAYVSEQAFANHLPSDTFNFTSATGTLWGSGGGNSTDFKKPLYQFLVSTGNDVYRTVPDISLHMGGCPVAGDDCKPSDSSDVLIFGGTTIGVIGTSASAPAFAGLTALLVQRFGHRIGNENYYIYGLAAAQNAGTLKGVFNTGIPGENGLFTTTPKGYNRVLGNGTVNGVNFLLAPGTSAAGIPQTPTNP